MLRSMLSSATQPTRTTLPGWLMLRLWLLLGLTLPALSLGGWARPASVCDSQVAEQGVHAGPSGQTSPAEIPQELPLRGETDDAEDGKDSTERAEDAKGARALVRARSTSTPSRLTPTVELQLVAAVEGYRFAEAQRRGPEPSHGKQLRNRGPPLA